MAPIGTVTDSALYGGLGNESAARTSDPQAESRAKAGFGKNTVSPAGAAIQTLSGAIQGARDIVPQLKELREELRAKREEQEEASSETRETAARLELTQEATARAAQETTPAQNRPQDAEEDAPQRVRPEAMPHAQAFANQERSGNVLPSVPGSPASPNADSVLNIIA